MTSQRNSMHHLIKSHISFQPELVTQLGYACEEHQYTTADGYVNTLFHMPPSPKSGGSPSPSSRSAKARSAGSASDVVFLQHGLFASAEHFVIGEPSKTLGEQLMGGDSRSR
jgi:hypothetical protein